MREPDLEAELWPSIVRARSRMALWADVIPIRVHWGLAPVQLYGPDRGLYEPAPDGAPAFITPVVEGGELVDLAAIGLRGGVALRLGLGHGLGLDAVERARYRACILRLCLSPITWLRAPLASDPDSRLPIEAVHLFDLAHVTPALDGVAPIVCDGFRQAERVQAMLPPSQRGRVVVPERGRS